jgi:hypothetical protein
VTCAVSRSRAVVMTPVMIRVMTLVMPRPMAALTALPAAALMRCPCRSLPVSRSASGDP